MKSKFAWFSIVIFGVILFGMPAVYATDLRPERSVSAYQKAMDDPIAAIEGIAANREAVIEELVQMWFMDIPGWEAEFRSLLNLAKDSKLLAILNAESYAEVQAILGGGTPDFYSADSMADPFALGDTDKDFVFTPVKPCRIVDTRKAGGKIPSGGSRGFYVHGSGAQMNAQGGNPAGCPSPRGEPRAVHMNIVAVNSEDSGWLTVWPIETSRPLAGILNYYPGRTDPVSNAFTVKTSFAMGLDIGVYAHKTTHVVADVMGYYHDVVDAPGFDYSQTDLSFYPLSKSESSPTLLRSQTLTCPSAGWVVAQATTYAELYAGTDMPGAVPGAGISLNTTVTYNRNNSAYADHKQGINVNAGDYVGSRSLSVQNVWNCSAGQSITIFMTGVRHPFAAGDATKIRQPTLVLNYFSSRY